MSLSRARSGRGRGWLVAALGWVSLGGAPAAAWGAVSGSARAAGAAPEAAEPADLSLRATGMFGADYVMLGLAGSRPLARSVGVEATAALGTASGSPAALFELLVRLGHHGQRHALTFGVGPSLLSAAQYGGVVLLQSELGYEYRIGRTLSLLVGYGPALVLTESAARPCDPERSVGCGSLYREQFHPGNLSVRARLALGVAF